MDETFPSHDAQAGSLAAIDAAISHPIEFAPLAEASVEDLFAALDQVIADRRSREAATLAAIENSVHAFGRIEPVFMQRLELEREATDAATSVRDRLAAYAADLTEDLARFETYIERVAAGDGAASLEGMALLIIARGRRGEYTHETANALIAAISLAIRSQNRLARSMAEALVRIGASDRPSSTELAKIQTMSREFDEVARVGAALANHADRVGEHDASSIRRIVDEAIASGDIRIATVSLAQVAARISHAA